MMAVKKSISYLDTFLSLKIMIKTMDEVHEGKKQKRVPCRLVDRHGTLLHHIIKSYTAPTVFLDTCLPAVPLDPCLP